MTSHSKQLTHVHIDTFTDKELVKVFNYAATKILKKTPFTAKRALKFKKGEKLTWDHLVRLLRMYGIHMQLTITYDDSASSKSLAMSKINYNRIAIGLKALPEPTIETLPED